MSVTNKPEVLEAIFEGSPDAIVVADSDGRYLAANAAAGELFGLAPSELVGRQVAEFAPTGYDTPSQFASFLLDGTAIGQFTVVRGDGTVRHVEYHARADLTPGTHISVLRDITGRDRVLQMIRESEEQLARTFYATPVPMALRAMDTGRNLLVNQGFVELTGYYRSELVGESVKALKIWVDPGAFEAAQEQVGAGAVVANRELRLRRKDGRILACRVSFGRFETASGVQIVVAVVASSPEAI